MFKKSHPLNFKKMFFFLLLFFSMSVRVEVEEIPVRNTGVVTSLVFFGIWLVIAIITVKIQCCTKPDSPEGRVIQRYID